LIAVLDYGIGNLRSAEKALQHLGANARLISDPDEATVADGVVLPGVGAFGACMSALRTTGLDKVALSAVEAGVPFLGICVGMQMLYEGSDEDVATPGLGILDGRVVALSDDVKRPQMQWNVLERVGPASPILDGLGESPWMYFVHSFAPEMTADVVAICEYGGPVVAASRRGRTWATQFHPEKSGVGGLRLLSNFIAAVDEAA
jgi:glutamine amidotransferase